MCCQLTQFLECFVAVENEKGNKFSHLKNAVSWGAL